MCNVQFCPITVCLLSLCAFKVTWAWCTFLLERLKGLRVENIVASNPMNKWWRWLLAARQNITHVTCGLQQHNKSNFHVGSPQANFLLRFIFNFILSLLYYRVGFAKKITSTSKMLLVSENYFPLPCRNKKVFFLSPCIKTTMHSFAENKVDGSNHMKSDMP